MLMAKRFGRLVICLLLAALPVMAAEYPASVDKRPRVVVIGVNGMEWDIIRPLLLRGELPNLAHVLHNGVYGKLKTVPSPNCPKVYTAIATSTPPDQNGITGFLVGGITANTNKLT